MELASLLSQLEETKFVRLFRHLVDAPPTDGLHHFERSVALDLPNTEVHHTMLTEIGSRSSSSSSWYFQIAHCPPPLWDPAAFRIFVRNSLTTAFSDLAGRADLMHSVCCSDYYFFTNVCDVMFNESSEEFLDVAHDLFSRILRVPPRDHPRFGFSTPQVLAAQAQSHVQSFIVDLLNQPSAYYLIARDRHVSVVPVTEHGMFFSTLRPQTSNANVLATVVTSTLPVDLSKIDVFKRFEALINDPNALERDLQAFLEANPALLLGLDRRYCEVRPHVCLYESHEERLVPDFMARIEDSNVWDLIELKLPEQKLLVRSTADPRPSAAAARGIAELLRYGDVFNRKRSRQRFADRFGTAAFEPGLILVIGRGQARQRYDWRTTHAGFPTVQVVSYDYLLEHARNCTQYLHSTR